MSLDMTYNPYLPFSFEQVDEAETDSKEAKRKAKEEKKRRKEEKAAKRTSITLARDAAVSTSIFSIFRLTHVIS
jgi:hypothetical protein